MVVLSSEGAICHAVLPFGVVFIASGLCGH